MVTFYQSDTWLYRQVLRSKQRKGPYLPKRTHYERFLIWHLFGHCVVQFRQQIYMANDGDKRLLVVTIERRTAWSTLRTDCGHGIQTTTVSQH